MILRIYEYSKLKKVSSIIVICLPQTSTHNAQTQGLAAVIMKSYFLIYENSKTKFAEINSKCFPM